MLWTSSSLTMFSKMKERVPRLNLEMVEVDNPTHRVLQPRLPDTVTT